ncbi:hypothetical protein TGME49_269380 [Toxoplasma gondii ME49]|uniref:Uncharacterized protein n=1 Tax=Toxoplasma gondii (strain ATCC 50611 / Me49) TaxID=508771 RepID=S8F4F8_TOXGM|nr:hypothetical protein TGME49_269380 [Toxoplasma gondii ME49]EPT28328.1 hypothetical protein TGME49_269380 [Toxoplasma gondii ME49]|eukprot:XP_002365629.1 hypothetical protein TGME49_269380 [Toxoplasma gondii ME49]
MKRFLFGSFILWAGLCGLAAIDEAEAQWGISRNGRWGAHRASGGGATFSASRGTGAPSVVADSGTSSSRDLSPPVALPSSAAASGGTTFSPYAARVAAAAGPGPVTPFASPANSATPPPLTQYSPRQGPVTYPTTSEPFPSTRTSTTFSPASPAWAPRPAQANTSGSSGLSNFIEGTTRPAWNPTSVSPSLPVNRGSEAFLSRQPQSLTNYSTRIAPANASRSNGPASVASSGDSSIPASLGTSDSHELLPVTRLDFTETRLSSTRGINGMNTWGTSPVAAASDTGVPWTGMSLSERTDENWSTATAAGPRTSVPNSMSGARTQSLVGGAAAVNFRSEGFQQASSDTNVSRSWTTSTAETSNPAGQEGGDWTMRSSRAAWSNTNESIPTQSPNSSRGTTGRNVWASANGSEGQATAYELSTHTPFRSGDTPSWTSSTPVQSASDNIEQRPWETTESAAFPSANASEGSHRSADHGSTSSVRNSDANRPTESSFYASNVPRNNASSWDAATPVGRATDASTSDSDRLPGADTSNTASLLPNTNSRRNYGQLPPLDGPLMQPIPFSTGSTGNLDTSGGFRSGDSSVFSSREETVNSRDSRIHQLPSPVDRPTYVSDHSPPATLGLPFALPMTVESGTGSFPGQSSLSANATGARYDSSVESRGTEITPDSPPAAASVYQPSNATTPVPSHRSGSQARGAEANDGEFSYSFSSRQAMVDHIEPSQGLLPFSGSEEERDTMKREPQETFRMNYCDDGSSQCGERSGMIPPPTDRNVTTVLSELPGSTFLRSNPISQTDDDEVGLHRVGYIPPSAFNGNETGAGGSRAEPGGRNFGQQPRDPGELLYGGLNDYLKDAEDPYAGYLGALSRAPYQEKSPDVSATTTSPPYTYPATYNPYSDNIDVDQIPDSPYHNYAYAEDPFPSPYSTHSRLENYGAEFNNRYYHERRIAPNISWGDYTQRKKALEEARKREEQLLQEGRIGVLEASETSFQGLIGYPSGPHPTNT